MQQPRVFYPGLPGLISATYALSLGTQPGVIVAVLLPDLSRLAGVGDFTFTDGERSLTIRNARVADGVADVSISGFTVTSQIEDGRWEWRFATVTGHYNQQIPRVYDTPRVPDFGQPQGNQNQPDPNVDQYIPPLQEWSRKSARDLAKVLCEAIKPRGGYDIDALPDTEYPETMWDASPAAQELDSLCDGYGCRVAFDPQKLDLKVVKLGDGEPMPSYPDVMQQDGLGVKPPAIPKVITVYGSGAVYQQRFRLRAVGEEFDGQYKPIDRLSYRPLAGWTTLPPPFLGMAAAGMAQFLNPLPGDRTTREAQALAANSIYKCYQVDYSLPLVGPEAIRVPAYSRDPVDVVRRDHLLLLDRLAEVVADDLGQRIVRPARVYGRAYRMDRLDRAYTDAKDRVLATFDVDALHRMIKFHNYVYLNEKKPGVEGYTHPAELVLETSCLVLDPGNHNLFRWRKQFPLGQDVPEGDASGQPGEWSVIRENVRYVERLEYTEDGNHQYVRSFHNQGAIEKMADFYARAEAAKFQTVVPQTRLFNAVIPVRLDGAIQQATWSISSGGVTTQVSRSNEHNPWVPAYAFRRQFEFANVDRAVQQRQQGQAIRRQLSNDDPFSR